MLSSVRQALDGDPSHASQPANLDALPPLSRVLEPIDAGELVTRFEQELGKVAVSPHRVQSRLETRELLGSILDHDRASGVVLSRNPLLDRLKLRPVLEELGIPSWTWSAEADAAPYRHRCFSAVAGITGVDFALAESGSLVLSSATEGAQLSSLAPPVHIAFYLRSQVVESLEEVLDGVAKSAGAPSESIGGRSIVLITGTSRTADIEQILIRGVHGPREVHAVLVEDSYLTD